jgi:glyoxylase-like metal-dependent hydrolase (beta-lactamase superfamily II)
MKKTFSGTYVWSVTLLLLVLTSLSAVPVLGQDEIPVNSRRLSKRVLVTWSCDYFQGTNMTALTTSEGIVLIDTGLSPTMVKRQRELIERELGRNDFRYIINTHVHNDHAFANEVFPEAVVVGHADSVAEMRREVELIPELLERLRSGQADYQGWAEWAVENAEDPEEEKQAREGVAAYAVGIGDLERGISPRYPSLTFTGHESFQVGDLQLRLYPFMGFHSDSDILILVPSEKILFTGDVFASGELPWIRLNSAGGFLGMMDTWKAILDACPDLETIVTGHSDIPFTVEEFRASYGYLSQLWDAVCEAQEAGIGLERFLIGSDFKEQFPEVAEYRYLYRDLNFHQHNVTMMWQLAGGLDPD